MGSDRLDYKDLTLMLLFVWNTLHSFIDSFDNHSTASGPASCLPGNAVIGSQGNLSRAFCEGGVSEKVNFTDL